MNCLEFLLLFAQVKRLFLAHFLMRVLFSANLSFKQNRFTIKMKLYLVIFSLLAAAFSWIAFRAYIMLDLDKSKDLFNHKSCIRVSNFPGVEDITMFKNVAIGCTGNLGEVIEQNNPNAVPNGSLVLIDPAKQTVSPIEIKGFPQDIAFHPHGSSTAAGHRPVPNPRSPR